MSGIYLYGTGQRQALEVCCDGLPHGIIQALKEECVLCMHKDCQGNGDNSYMSFSAFKEHHLEKHNEAYKYVREFDWLYLRLADGHFEHTALMSSFKINWILFFFYDVKRGRISF